jgi:hypothetical protein
VALCQARTSTKPLWGLSSSNPYHPSHVPNRCKLFSTGFERECKVFLLPSSKMIGRAICHLIEKENICSLLIIPVWTSAAFWPAMQQSYRFRGCVLKELRFKPKFYMSN